MTDRRNFLTACLNGAAWLMGWKPAKPKRTILTYRIGDNGTVGSGVVTHWNAVREIGKPALWTVYVKFEDRSQMSFTTDNATMLPMIGERYEA